MNTRLQRLRDALAERELDGALISNAQNRRYLSGFTGSAGYLLITPTTPSSRPTSATTSRGGAGAGLPAAQDDSGLRRLGRRRCSRASAARRSHSNPPT